MTFKTLSSLIGVALVIWLNSCVTDISMPAEGQGYLNLTVERASLAETNNKLQESTPENIRNVVITIQDLKEMIRIIRSEH